MNGEEMSSGNRTNFFGRIIECANDCKQDVSSEEGEPRNCFLTYNLVLILKFFHKREGAADYRDLVLVFATQSITRRGNSLCLSAFAALRSLDFLAKFCFRL